MTAHTKKNHQEENQTQDTTMEAFTLTADPLPKHEAPKAPDGFVPGPLGALLRNGRPAPVQVALAPKMAGEIRSSVSWIALLGASAPSHTAVADALSVAAGWSHQLALAQAWFEYVRRQEAVAWKHATGVLDSVRQPFRLVSDHDPKVAAAFPATTQYFGFARAKAQRAANARKNKKKEENKQTDNKSADNASNQQTPAKG
jgi:hypothetical protein